MRYSRKKKGVAYYARMFLSASIAILLVAIISQLTGWPSADFIEAIEALFLLPFFLIMFLLIFNFVSSKTSGPIDKREAEHNFVMRTSKKVRQDLDYGKEDFRELQSSEKFQTFYQDIYNIYANGENDSLNFEHLQNRFSEDDFEYDAVNIVIDEAKTIIQEEKEESQKQSKKKK